MRIAALTPQVLLDTGVALRTVEAALSDHLEAALVALRYFTPRQAPQWLKY